MWVIKNGGSMKKIIRIGFFSLLMLGILGCGSTNDENVTNELEELRKENERLKNEMAEPEPTKEPLFGNINIGDTVVFGVYEQDDNPNNIEERIEWLVVDIQDDKALLLSKYALDSVSYHDDIEDVKWQESNLRKWMNDDFYNAAFNEEEKRCIIETDLSNPGNRIWDVEKSDNTKDFVFALSIDEVERYFPESTNGECKELATSATNFAVKNGAAKQEGGKEWWSRNCTWYLRTPGHGYNCVSFILGSGEIAYKGFVVMIPHAVRPAIWVKLY